MGRTMFPTILLYSLSFFTGLSTAALKSCPTASEQITTTDGSIYAICQQADFRGETVSISRNVATLADCVRACNEATQCTSAVFDKTAFICHLKGTKDLDWISDQQYTTIKFVSKPVQGSIIKACPTTETNVTSSTGMTLATCPNTDYEGETSRTLNDITSVQACAIACSQNSRCSRAVFQSDRSQCHIKTDPTKLNWVFRTGKSTVRTVSTLVDGSSISACPGGFKNITIGSGAAFAICQSADYAIPSVDIIQKIASVEACAFSCSSQQNCLYASYDSKNSICYTKGDSNAPNWTFNKQFTSLQLVNTTKPSTNAKKGQWSKIIPFPIIPVAAYVVPQEPSSSRLLVFSSWGSRAFSGPTGITQFADYNFATGAVSQREVANTKHDMFCPGISSIAGGKIVISGGENAEAVSIYDPIKNTFTRAADMSIARGYQTSATMSDGRVFTIGGSFTGGLDGKTGEVYDPVGNKWLPLPGTSPAPLLTKDREGIFREDNHAWLFGWRNGSVFQAGPSKAMNWYYTSGNGASKPAGIRTTTMDQMCGINVMYDVGKILTAGGSQDYTDSDGTAQAHRITITEPGVAATVEKLPNMNRPRGFANAVVLPNGQIFVNGGQARSLVFTDIDSVLIPEMWDPQTNVWTQLAPAAVPRNYHSVSLLLPDGTVFVGGGGMCPASQGDDLSWCDRAKDHFDGEIYSPPYLFTATGAPASRPTISALSATTAAVGSTITVTLQNSLDGATFSLVRMGSATHSINSDQRRVPLTSVKSTGAGKYAIVLPTDSGVLIPGSWYLFAISKEGVPSIAKTFNVQVKK